MHGKPEDAAVTCAACSQKVEHRICSGASSAPIAAKPFALERDRVANQPQHWTDEIPTENLGSEGMGRLLGRLQPQCIQSSKRVTVVKPALDTTACAGAIDSDELLAQLFAMPDVVSSDRHRRCSGARMVDCMPPPGATKDAAKLRSSARWKQVTDEAKQEEGKNGELGSAHPVPGKLVQLGDSLDPQRNQNSEQVMAAQLAPVVTACAGATMPDATSRDRHRDVKPPEQSELTADVKKLELHAMDQQVEQLQSRKDDQPAKMQMQLELGQIRRPLGKSQSASLRSSRQFSDSDTMRYRRAGFAADAQKIDGASFPADSTDAAKRKKHSKTSSLMELLDLWKTNRHSSDPIDEKERQSLAAVLFETMPPETVKMVDATRVTQPEMLHAFCKEESDSLLNEQSQTKKHQEFMFLHGTRWEFAPLICKKGLDPECGHLGKGSWLGQSAASAHTYAAKGPGPASELRDGHRLFAMFAVACVPNRSEGDGERSFGVWRIMRQKRMYPAYYIVYSAPMDIRSRRLSPVPHMLKSHPSMQKVPNPGSSSVQELTSTARCRIACSNSSIRCRSASPLRARSKQSPLVPEDQVHEGGHQNMRPFTAASLTSLEEGHAESPSRPKRHQRNASLHMEQNVPNSSWEVQADTGWIPFKPVGKFKDRPGTVQQVVCGQFWYALTFDDDGVTGNQTNLHTGKIRPIRRVWEISIPGWLVNNNNS